MSFLDGAPGQVARAATVGILAASAMATAGCSAAPMGVGEETGVGESAIEAPGGDDEPPVITPPPPPPVCLLEPPLVRGSGQCLLENDYSYHCPIFKTFEAQSLGCSGGQGHYYRYNPGTSAQPITELMYMVCSDRPAVEAFAKRYAAQGVHVSTTLPGNCVGRSRCGDVYLTCSDVTSDVPPSAPVICSGGCPGNGGVVIAPATPGGTVIVAPPQVSQFPNP